MSSLLKVGIVGCGAVTERFHLPSLQKMKGVRLFAFVDKDVNRLKELQKEYKAFVITDSYKDILQKVDVAIIALPNFLHSPVSIEFLQSGAHIFCEKPISTNVRDAKLMIEAAQKNKRKLGIGMVRRYFSVNRRIYQLLSEKTLGKPESFDYEEGAPFNWPLRSTYAFNQKDAGGGVLMDMGAHVMDFLVYLFGNPSKIRYKDDAFGGVEANCQIQLYAGGVLGRVELSRERLLRNTFVIRCSNGALEAVSGGVNTLTVKKNGKEEIITWKERFEDGIEKELAAFIDAIQKNTPTYVSGEDVLPSLQAIEYCYTHRETIDEPWRK